MKRRHERVSRRYRFYTLLSQKKMKITNIFIENYKSVNRLDIVANPWLNVFIWENSSGKSNIFNAINRPIWSIYPSFNSTTKLDHRKWETNNKIRIKIDYNTGESLELAEEWTDYKWDVKSWLNLNWGYIKSEQREWFCSAYLWVDRQIKDYLPSNKWTLIWRILQQINQQFEKESMLDPMTNTIELKKDVLKKQLHDIRDNILFSVGRWDAWDEEWLMDKFISILQKESASQLNRSEESFSIDLSLYDPWNFYRTLQLLVHEVDLDMEFQASSLWMWVQASITIAILKAYAELKLPNKTPIFIDEPELFLHPQAQRNFYNILRKMTEDQPQEDWTIKEGLQIFYTTHSPDFLRTDKFDEIFIVRKNSTIGTYVNSAKVEDFVEDFTKRTGRPSDENWIKDRFRNAYENTGDSQKANEAFFANKIILVEWQSESLLLPYFFDLINYDYTKDGVSVVRCWGKSELDRFFRLYNELWIPCFIIFDWDKQNEWTADETATKKKNNVITWFFWTEKDRPDWSVNERYLWFENEIGHGLWYTTTKKGIDLFIEIKSQIPTVNELPSRVALVVDKVKVMDTSIPSILQKTIDDE